MRDFTITAPKGEPIMTLERIFDAPRALVWRTFVDPVHRAAWWGPHGHRNEVTDWDVSPGGKWRIVSHIPGGRIMIFIGEFREIEAPNRLVATFGMENMYEGHTILEEHHFEETNGLTTYRGISYCDTLETRDGMLASGMEVGVREGFERLDAILERLKTEG